MGDRQGASSQCDKARKEFVVSECCETQVLDHGWALVICVGTSLPSSVGWLLQEKDNQGRRDFFWGGLTMTQFGLGVRKYLGWPAVRERVWLRL